MVIWTDLQYGGYKGRGNGSEDTGKEKLKKKYFS